MWWENDEPAMWYGMTRDRLLNTFDDIERHVDGRQIQVCARCKTIHITICRVGHCDCCNREMLAN